ncbi:MAG: hypothetical protein JSU00_07440 [Acidobacteria bacterium]|nr:hypothetical protein [Acidobacteriota bacterium]
MSLFTDGPPATIDDLRRYDSAADSLSRDAGVDLDAKLSVAAEEVGQELFTFLLFLCPAQGSAASPYSNTPPAEEARRRIGLADVVVSEPLRRWHAMRALAGLYRDLYCSDVTDRYKNKWDSYEILAKQTAEYTFSTGIGICRNPVPKAPVALVSQTSQTAARVDCSIYLTWVRATGEEGAPGEMWQASMGPGDQVIAALPAPDGITGWNVYLGLDQNAALKQNSAPLPVDAPYTIPTGLTHSGSPLGDGQKADILVVERRMIPRG